jgi:CDP-4-dehydro-6-deoxyglucose reductase
MNTPDATRPAAQSLACRVEKVEYLSRDVLRLYLVPQGGKHLRHRAGQYVDVVLHDGVRRSFSIANAPHKGNHIELHIRHVDGGEFSDYIFRRVKTGDALEVMGPYGSFFLRGKSRRPVILMAGGTGFAPIKGLVEEILSLGAKRTVHLYWGVRTREDLYLHALAQQWCAEPDFHYVPVLSDAADDTAWTGRRGLVHQAVVEDFPDLSDYEVYANGPRAMIQSAREVCLRHDLPEELFYFDAA